MVVVRRRNLPIYINSQEVLMEQCWNEPSFWRPPFPKTAYDQLIGLNRRTVKFLTVFQAHLAYSARKRPDGARQLIDEPRAELKELRNAMVQALDELAGIITVNRLDTDAREQAQSDATPGVRRHAHSQKFRELRQHLNEFNVTCVQRHPPSAPCS